MSSENLYLIDFEDYSQSSIDYISEGKDGQLVDLFIDNIATKYNFLETEVELRMFQNLQQYGGISNTLNKHQFELLEGFFDNHSSFTEDVSQRALKHTLDISVHSNNYVDPRDDLSNLRFTLENKADIKKFCSSNIIPKNCKVIYKGRYSWDDSLRDRIAELNRDYKFKKHLGEKQQD